MKKTKNQRVPKLSEAEKAMVLGDIPAQNSAALSEMFEGGPEIRMVPSLNESQTLCQFKIPRRIYLARDITTQQFILEALAAVLEKYLPVGWRVFKGGGKGPRIYRIRILVATNHQNLDKGSAAIELDKHPKKGKF
jgi:hypothetical protein